VTGRRQLTSKYLSLLISYWKDAPLEGEWESDDSCQALKKELFDALGESQLYKRWLVASLWKNIKNQTQYQAFTMKRWVEFVKIMRRQVNST
jgi:hypothetical protein